MLVDRDDRNDPILLHAGADDDDVRGRRGLVDQRLKHSRDPDALENHRVAHGPSRQGRAAELTKRGWNIKSGPMTVGRSLGGIDHDVRAQFLSQSATDRRKIGGDYRTRPTRLKGDDDREPDWAASYDQGYRSPSQARFGDSMGADRKRLDQRRQFARQSVRNLQQQRFGQKQALCKPPVEARGKTDQFGPFGSERIGDRQDARAHLERTP